ncbi:MAG: nickel-dependent lactate racemase, partial [Candidatus Thermoplasmatota archaeon]|nr:nickel-dependent lactate racemase [Candidatus Thermoplasmatota archaeon]
QFDIISEERAISRALESPLGSPGLEDFVGNANDIIFIVNDSTRPTPTARILEHLLKRIPPHVKKSFIVACGTHRPPTPEEYVRLLGKKIVMEQENILLHHDANNKSRLKKVGSTPLGEDVIINREVAEAERVVVVSSVEPHYFAGFTGGRKSFLPGVAAYEKIEQNHAMSLHPGACTLRLAGNPVHEDMDRFARVAAGQKTYGLMTVVDGNGKVMWASAGDLFSAFEECVEKSRQIYAAPLRQKAEVVVSAAPHPTDINLYQSQKAMENGKLALKPGGILLLVASCPEGIGATTFYELLKDAKTPQNALATIARGYRFGYQKAARLAEIQTWARIWAKTDLAPQVLEDISIRPVEDLQIALEEAMRITGGKVVVMPEGSMTIPMLDGAIGTCSTT